MTEINESQKFLSFSQHEILIFVKEVGIMCIDSETVISECPLRL